MEIKLVGVKREFGLTNTVANYYTFVLEMKKDGYLYFDDAGLIACPNSIDGAWSVWVSVGIANPAGNSDCTPFAPKVVEVAEGSQVGCLYTE